jgi:carboxypeptidase D
VQTQQTIMIRLGNVLTLLSLLSTTVFSGPVVARHPVLRSLSAKHLEAVERVETSARQAGADNARRATETSTPSGVKNITFSNPKASGAYARVHASFVFFSHLRSEFYVDGRSIPDVNFDVGPSWSGLIPISGAANETRKVQLFNLGNAPDKLRLNLVLLIFQLFFWFFPPGPEGSLDDLIFWYDFYLYACFVWTVY